MCGKNTCDANGFFVVVFVLAQHTNTWETVATLNQSFQPDPGCAWKLDGIQWDLFPSMFMIITLLLKANLDLFPLSLWLSGFFHV